MQTMGGSAAANSAADGRLEFRFNTTEGRVYDCYVEDEKTLQMWLDAMPHWTANLVMGWLHKRKLGAKSKRWDRRYIIFDPQMLHLPLFPVSLLSPSPPTCV